MPARKLSNHSSQLESKEIITRSFDTYAEDEASLRYGLPADDPFGNRFPEFEYSLP